MALPHCAPQEFEVLAQLSALQSSCRSYRLQPRPHFQRWLWGLRVLPEGHRWGGGSYGAGVSLWGMGCPYGMGYGVSLWGMGCPYGVGYWVG